MATPPSPDEIAAHLVRRSDLDLSPCDAAPGPTTIALARCCLDLVTEMLQTQVVPARDRLGTIAATATEWARDGVPLSTTLRICHEATRVAFSLTALAVEGPDVDTLVAASDLTMQLLDTVSAEAADAYAAEARRADDESAAQALAVALLSGRADTALAREAGVEIANSYQVVAVAIPERATGRRGRDNQPLDVARRGLNRLLAELGALFESRMLPLLDCHGGTVLVALTEDATELDSATLARLSKAAEVPLTATTVIGTAEDIPEAAEHAHELLALVRAGNRPPGLYPMADMAVEYQLMRGGAVSRLITAMLDPLETAPELLETLRVYLTYDMNRQRTARRLHVHPNTVDYRLRRITRLTGLDLTTAVGICRAAHALIAYDHRRSCFDCELHSPVRPFR
ncbi:PucR family transcriptional regulator [Nocardia harenae]|uniref:PucR family transcriptional regulator n=1 Tax=Nocardia harenae TaxID=358707 RepID=UPI000833A52B|nr:PucR family transcriptional regulator [Nocardia harenae]